MPPVVLAIITITGAICGAVFGFLGKLLIDRPLGIRQVQQQRRTDGDSFLLGEANYLQDALKRLRHDFEESERKRATAEAECTQKLAAKDKDIEALRTLTAKLSLRLDSFETGGRRATP